MLCIHSKGTQWIEQGKDCKEKTTGKRLQVTALPGYGMYPIDMTSQRRTPYDQMSVLDVKIPSFVREFQEEEENYKKDQDEIDFGEKER